MRITSKYTNFSRQRILNKRNIDYLAENHLDGYISTRKLSRKLKKINKKDKPFGKDKFTFDLEKKTHIFAQWDKHSKTKKVTKTTQE